MKVGLQKDIIGLVLNNYILNKVLRCLNGTRSRILIQAIKQKEFSTPISFIGSDRVGNIFILKQNTYYPPTFREKVMPKITAMILMEAYLLATGHDDGSISLWDTEGLELIQNSKVHKNDITCIIKVDEHIIATSSWDKTVKIIDLSSDSITTLTGHERFVNHLAKINLSTIASASCDNTIKIWKYDSCVKTITEHSDSVNALLVINNCLLSGSSDKTIRAWECNNGYICKYTINLIESVNTMALLMGDLFASGGNEKVVAVYNVISGQVINKLTGHSGEISSLSYYNNQLCSGDSLGFVKTWSLVTGSNRNTFRAHATAIVSICYQDTDDILTCTWDSNIKKWDLNITKSLAHGSEIKALLKLGKYSLVSGGKDKLIRLWNLQNGKCIRILKGHKKPVECVIKYNKDKLISADKSIYVWDITTGSLIKTYRKHKFEVTDLFLLPGDRIISASPKERLIILSDILKENTILTINEGFLMLELLNNKLIMVKDDDFLKYDLNSGTGEGSKGKLSNVLGIVRTKNYLISYNLDDLEIMSIEGSYTDVLRSPCMIKTVKHQYKDKVVIVGINNEMLILNLLDDSFEEVLNQNSYDILTVFKI
jgi:WD40 repeat protein